MSCDSVCVPRKVWGAHGIFPVGNMGVDEERIGYGR